MQLDIFKHSKPFEPKERGLINWFSLSIHEKINMKSHYFKMYWNLPYSYNTPYVCGTIDGSLKYYVEKNYTIKPKF